MPLTLTLAHTPRLALQVYATLTPWRVLHAQAGELEGQLQTLWDSVFSDLADSLDVATLAAALAHGPLAAEHTAWSAWHAVTQAQTRAPLLALLHGAAGSISEALMPGLQQLLQAPALRFDVPTPDMTHYIDQYVGQQLVDVTQTTLANIRGVVRDAVAEGRTVQQTARAIRPLIGLTPRQTRAVEALRQRLTDEGQSPAQVQRAVELAAARGVRLRAQQIARTESMDVANEANHQLNQQAQDEGWLPADQRRQWQITDDQRTCPAICKPIPEMNPQGVGLGEPFETPIGPIMRPPAHPQCLTGDTLIAASSRITAVSKRWYDGEMVHVLTCSDKQLTCTPNHPILTRHGWIAAGLLHAGDNILCTSRQQGVVLIDMDHKTMPSVLEEITQTFFSTGQVTTREMPITAEDFHGDGTGSQVAVIGTDGLLRHRAQSTLRQHIVQHHFQGRALAQALIAQGGLYQRGLTPLAAMGCAVCRFCLMTTCLGRHLAPFQGFGFASASTWNMLLAQHPCNNMACNAFTICEGLFRHTGLIVAEDLVEVRKYMWQGHVYNLQTDDGWYSGNNIITHNCRCAVNLVMT